MTNERNFFECWAKTQGYDLDRMAGPNGEYYDQTTNDSWLAWQGRASMPALEPRAPLAQDVIGTLERLVAESDGVNDDHSRGYYEGAKKALEIAKGGSLDLGPFLGMEQELRECRRDLDLLNKAGARVREDSEGHRYVELRASKSI